VKKSTPGNRDASKENTITSVKIKKEVLESIKEKGNLPKNVTPDVNKKHRAKPDKSTNLLLQDDTEMDIDNLPKEKEIKIKKKKAIITKDNVKAYVIKTPLRKLQLLDKAQAKKIIRYWYQAHDKEEPPKGFKPEDELKKIKDSTTEMNRKFIGDELEKEVDAEIDRVRKIKLDENSSLNDIKNHSVEDLAFFIYDKSLELDDKSPTATEILENESDAHIYEMVAQLLSPKKTPAQLKVTSSNSHPQQFRIHSEMTNEELESMNINALQTAFHEFSINCGEEIPRSTIEEWDINFLREICITKRNNLKIQQKMLKSMQKPSSMKPSSLRPGTRLRQTNLRNNGKTMNTCRYSIYFKIPDNFKGTDGLREFLSLIFTEMVKYGDELCILPWSTDSITNAITDVESLPTTITGIKKYFEGAKSPEASVQLYLKIRLGYSIRMKKCNFDADVQGWCKAQSIQMYECSVQHPHVKSCGWLVYLPRTVNQQKWCQKVIQMYESTPRAKNQTPFQIGLTWRALNGQWEVEKSSKVRAMHIDAPIDIAQRVKNFLRILAQKKKWPLNVRFRVMDEYSKYMKDSTKQKYRYMVSKHKCLLNQLGMCECNQIMNPDLPIGSSRMTLRDVILNIRDKSDNHRIFASLDEKWNSDTLFMATYRPDKSTKAYDFIRSISTYALYLFPNASFKKILTHEAINKAENESYNPASQTFTTQEDIELDKEIQADLDDDSFDFAKPDDLDNPFEFEDPTKLVGGENIWDLNGDDDTASTNLPNGMGNVSFDSATCRYYDPGSCSSSVQSNTSTNHKKNSMMKKTSTMHSQIAEELNILAAASDNDDEMSHQESEAADEE